MPRPRERAFTLLELLVVLAAITFAAWLAYDLIGDPVVGERRSSNVCPNNLRSIGDAVQEYRSRHGGALPPGFAALAPS